jgi:hypothetical protein
VKRVAVKRVARKRRRQSAVTVQTVGTEAVGVRWDLKLPNEPRSGTWVGSFFAQIATRMAQLFYDSDADLSLLNGKTVAIIGYGSQGHAHALNLKDSGVNVVVGLYEGSRSADKARADGLEVLSVADACAKADWIMVLLPDEAQKAVYEKEIAPHLSAG